MDEIAKLVTKLANNPRDSETVNFGDYLSSGWKSFTFLCGEEGEIFFPLLNLGYVVEGL